MDSFGAVENPPFELGLSSRCNMVRLAIDLMRPPDRAIGEHFHREVAAILELPVGSVDAEVRKAIFAQGV
jgi:hypothetical protein